jgi:hypothetical protein
MRSAHSPFVHRTTRRVRSAGSFRASGVYHSGSHDGTRSTDGSPERCESTPRLLRRRVTGKRCVRDWTGTRRRDAIRAAVRDQPEDSARCSIALAVQPSFRRSLRGARREPPACACVGSLAIRVAGLPVPLHPPRPNPPPDQRSTSWMLHRPSGHTPEADHDYRRCQRQEQESDPADL